MRRMREIGYAREIETEKLRGALDALAAGDPLDDKRVAGGATDEVRVG